MTAADPHPRKHVAVLDSEMAYVDTGTDNGAITVVLQHGNPMSSYLWRNVIPEIAPHARCLAPDLIGMGQSGKAPDGNYRFSDHVRYLDAWFDAAIPDGKVLLVIHDWGSALGFHWAKRHPDRVAGIAYMEGIVQPLRWEDWPEAAQGIFKGFRSENGEDLVLNRNMFIEGVVPASVIRPLEEAEMNAVRAPFTEPGETRRPMLTWPREIPIDGEPADMVALVAEYGEWLAQSELPKLFVNADPGSILVGPQREFCRSWPNQTEITVPGLHFIQEDSGPEIGRAVAGFLSSLNG